MIGEAYLLGYKSKSIGTEPEGYALKEVYQSERTMPDSCDSDVHFRAASMVQYPAALDTDAML